MRDDFAKDVIDELARRVSYRCSAPGCGRSTIGPRVDPAKSVNVGVAAHITAASPGGARHDPLLSSGQRRSAENGIWLCQTHAKLVDNDPARYPVELLRGWKQAAENRAIAELERGHGASASEAVTPTPEAPSLSMLAAQTANAQRLEAARRSFSHSEQGVRSLRMEFRALLAALQEHVVSIHGVLPMRVVQHDPAKVSVLAQRRALSVQLIPGRYANTLEHWHVIASVWNGTSPLMESVSREPERLDRRQYVLELEHEGVRWIDRAGQYTSSGLAEHLLRRLVRFAQIR